MTKLEKTFVAMCNKYLENGVDEFHYSMENGYPLVCKGSDYRGDKNPSPINDFMEDAIYLAWEHTQRNNPLLR